MIRIGLTSFAEHTSLNQAGQLSLFEYAGYLPLVEIDTAYYAIPKKSTIEKWLKDTPVNFRFVVKLYSGFTGQHKETYFTSFHEMVTAFLEAMMPLIQSGKLHCFLAQFPAQFKCTNTNVAYLKKLRQAFPDLPIAIELRDNSWYDEKYREKTYDFMKQQQFSLVMVDEPQVLDTPPLDLTVTNTDFALFRFHGRNQAYWKSSDPEWRKKRTLYRYNEEELSELSEKIHVVAEEVRETAVIFNNNAGGDAADNAQMMKRKLDLTYDGLNPLQIDLF